MDLARWIEVKRLVQEALELPPEERGAHVAAIADEALRHEAEALLAVSTARADLLDHYRALPPQDFAIPVQNGDLIGSYTVRQVLGRGGMGTVYLAEDTKNDRLVALKILSSRSARLAAGEHRLLARLSHPAIATLFDSGTTDTGLRYVAMEYVKGTPITTYCEECCPTVRSRLELFQKVCAAVAYAHGHLVVHRDLKPTNILVTDAGEPKLLDFGIAKLLSPDAADVTLTRQEERSLTVAFASPEQLGGEPTATATDIYSLGILLTFLLAGRLPYRAKSAYDLPWAIRNLDPEKPSALVPLSESAEETRKDTMPRGPALPEGNPRKLRRLLQGDLDAIALRALRKEPDGRYHTVTELSEDIRRYLASEPVSARRGTRRYRAAKFMKRHRFGVIGAAIALAVLYLFAAALFREQRETARERDKAHREAERATAVSRFLVDMFEVESPRPSSGRTVTVHEVLDNAVARLEAASPTDPGVRATLRHSLGKIYLKLGLHSSAETWLTSALPELEATRGEDRLLVAETLTDLAGLHYHHGRYGKAEKYAQGALPLFRGAKDADTRSLLGRVAFARGAFRRAEGFFREALDLRTRATRPDLASIAGARNDLACALHEQGRFREAAFLYRESLEARRKLFGEAHAEVLQSLHNLARLKEDEGDLPVAIVLRQRIYSLRDALSSYDLTLARIYQGEGALLLERKLYQEAAVVLDRCFLMQRRLLPDDHPDIARSLAELGRLSHALGRYDEAESSYHASIGRLDRALGPDHPDRISVANNLAVLLAERNRPEEAETLWQELAGHAAPLGIRPSIRRALAENLASLRRGGSRGEGTPKPYRLLGVSVLDLADPKASQIRPLSPPSPIARHRGGRLLFFDAFDDGRIDAERWEYGGNRAVEENGELRVLAAGQDNTGWARTRPILIDPRRVVRISRRAKVYPANRYFDGAMHVNVTGYPEKRFGLSYANYSYTGDGECVTVGFSLFRRDSNSHRYADRQANASTLLAPIWGEWFEEELIYDPQSGDVRYLLDGTVRLVWNVGPLPPGASSMTITFTAWGWYMGHYHYVDRLVVRQ